MNETYMKNQEDVPFVSIVVPAYNAPQRTANCIESLLKQTYSKNRYEIIVVDNGSTDETPIIIQKYPVIFLRECNIQSPYVARNKGIDHAKGDIIAFIDVNCSAIPDWLAQGVKALNQDNADLVGGNVTFVFSSDKTASEMFDSITNVQIEYNICNRNVTKGGNLFVKKILFDTIGMFPEYRSGGDVYWTKKATINGYKLVYAPKALVYYPARRLIPLLKKQFRVGRGQANMLIKDGSSYKSLIKQSLKSLIPRRRIYSVRNLVEDRGTEDMRAKVYQIWMAQYLCIVATSVGKIFYILKP